MSNIRYTYATNSNHDGLNYNLGDRYMYACDSQRPDFLTLPPKSTKLFENGQCAMMATAVLEYTKFSIIGTSHRLSHVFKCTLMLYGPILGPI